MSILQIFFACIAVFSIACIAAVLFFERKNPASSLVWVLALLLFPVAGFVFYLFLGSGYRVKKRKKYALKAATDNLYDNHIKRHLNFGHSRVFMEHHQNTSRLLAYLRNQADGVFTDNNNAEVFTDGGEMFAKLMEDMRNAKSHIHLLFYIFRNDRLGREILSILEQKAAEGVRVRLLYDSVGTMMATDKMFRPLKRAGGRVRAFSPIFSSLSSYLRLNYRNHRKIAVIDGLAGYVGGMNVGDEYRGADPVLTPWRDTHLRLTGSAVWFLQERFFMDWAHSSDEDPHTLDVAKYFPDPVEAGSMPMQIIAYGPDTHESPIKSGMLSMIYGARKSIYLQTPYFTPDESFADALRIAARSDVDVRLMIPRIGDYWIVQKATLGFVRDLLEAGAKIYMYNGFIHSKTMVVDGSTATIGSTNITNRSFTLDFEVDAFIHDQTFAQRCEAIFLADCGDSRLLPDDYFAKQGALARGGYNFARMLSPMM
jgi:cardiolipin synthase